MRRRVLGDEHVDRAVANTTDFTADFQTFITQYAWGNIWSRPGLDGRTRRLLVLAMIAALGRWEEFRLHVSTGLLHGLEICDVKETLLQTAVYAGVPAANTAFHIAQEEIKKSKKLKIAWKPEDLLDGSISWRAAYLFTVAIHKRPMLQITTSVLRVTLTCCGSRYPVIALTE
jgi:4-carboxymuconolactone decarboxylase